MEPRKRQRVLPDLEAWGLIRRHMKRSREREAVELVHRLDGDSTALAKTLKVKKSTVSKNDEGYRQKTTMPYRQK
jgi:hypothetical protein